MKKISMGPKPIYVRAEDRTTFIERHNRWLFFLLFMLPATLMFPCIAHAQQFHGKHFNNVDGNGIILGGYDAVAFLPTTNR